MINFLKNNKYIIISSMISLALGIVVFSLYYDIGLVNPFYEKWVYNNPVGDLKQFHTGWQYFRYAPWSFPLGMYNTLSYPIYTSVLNTLSIPLIAIPLKVLSPILPVEFQYAGLWQLSCFMFMSLVGMLIAKKFTENNFSGYTCAILVGMIFSLVPIIPVLAFWHFTVACHYFILLAFIPLLFDNMTLKQTLWLYGIIGFMTGAINAYILVMSGIIMMFYILIKIIKTKDYKYLYNILALSIPALFTMYISGAFSMNVSLQDINLLSDTFNLNGFFNSFGTGVFFNNMPTSETGTGAGQIIGYAYYGIGVMLFILFCAVLSILDLKSKKLQFDKVKFFTVLGLIIVSIILALSPRVTFNDKILFEVPLPQFIVDMWSIFRITGRFIWMAYYAIMLFSFCYFLKNFKGKAAVLILFVVLVLQLCDFTPSYKSSKNRNIEFAHTKDDYIVKMKKNLDKFFDVANKKNVYFDEHYSNQSQTNVNSIVMFAMAYTGIKHKLIFNNFYFARKVNGVNKEYRNSVRHAKDTDLFVLTATPSVQYIFANTKIRYFYNFKNNYIFASLTPINSAGNIANFSPISINAYNLPRIFRPNFPEEVKN